MFSVSKFACWCVHTRVCVCVTTTGTQSLLSAVFSLTPNAYEGFSPFAGQPVPQSPHQEHYDLPMHDGGMQQENGSDGGSMDRPFVAVAGETAPWRKLTEQYNEAIALAYPAMLAAHASSHAIQPDQVIDLVFVGVCVCVGQEEEMGMAGEWGSGGKRLRRDCIYSSLMVTACVCVCGRRAGRWSFVHKQTCTWGGQCLALAEYSCESCGPNTALCLEHMTGMHRTMNLTHVIKKWQRHVPVPHCAPFRLSRSLTIAPQAARACECDSTLDTPHSVVVLGLNGGDADVHYHCCQHPEHRAAWLVLYGYWPITPNSIKYAMPMTDFRLLTQVTHHITRLFLVCVWNLPIPN
jgi:hypothetical protein